MKKILLCAGIAVLAAGTAVADSEVGRTFRAVSPATGIEHVIVEISVGSVTVRTGTQNQIEVAGSIRRDYDGSERSRRRATEVIENTQVKIELRGDRAFVSEELGSGAGRGKWHHSELEVRITVPRGVNLDVKQSVGELDIKGDFRDVTAEMTVGELTVRLPRKNVKELKAGATIGEVHADLGDRVLSREGVFAGRTHFISETGIGVVDIRLKIGEVDITLD
jgi:hypothetical protein